MCKKLVLIPGWIEDALKASKVPLNAVLDLKKLSSILSKDDVAYYIATHDALLRKLFPVLANSFTVYDLFPWEGRNNNAFSKEELSLFQQTISNATLSNTGNSIPLYKAISAIPSTPVSATEQVEFGNAVNDYTFDIFELADGVAAIRPKLKEAGYSYTQQDRETYRAVIGFLCQYDTFENIATLPLFNHYTKLTYQLSTW